jgi:hypothetical protein
LADELGPEVDLAEFVVVRRELGQHCLLLVLKCIGLHCKKRLALFPSPAGCH